MFRRRDVEEIDAKQLAYGSSRAMQHLLLVLPVRHESWFDQLIDAMKYNGYQHIVDAIDRTGTIFTICFMFKMNFNFVLYRPTSIN